MYSGLHSNTVGLEERELTIVRACWCGLPDGLRAGGERGQFMRVSIYNVQVCAFIGGVHGWESSKWLQAASARAKGVDRRCCHFFFLALALTHAGSDGHTHPGPKLYISAPGLTPAKHNHPTPLEVSEQLGSSVCSLLCWTRSESPDVCSPC